MEAVAHQSHQDEHDVIGTAKFGMKLFLASEFMLFAALFAAYIILRNSGAIWLAPELVHHFSGLLNTILINTAILVSSSVTYHFAESAIEHGKSGVKWLFLTMAMGGYFVWGQYVEWMHLKHEGIWFDTEGQFGSLFFTITGFHGAHVLIGVLMIAYTMGRAMLGHFSKHDHVFVKNVGYYWHFVDGVWIIVLGLFYGEHIWAKFFGA